MTQIATLKKVLRAILIADYKHGIPLRQLERSYLKMEVQNIPLFGYPDTAALLNSLTDTIYTQFSQGVWMVYPVETEQTKHLSDLVRGQKRSSNRSSKSGNSGGGGCWPTNRHLNGNARPRRSNRQMIHQNGHGKYYPNDNSNAVLRNESTNYQTAVNNATNTSLNTKHEIISSNFTYQQSNGISSTKQVVNKQTIQHPKIDLMSPSDEEELSTNVEKIDLNCPLLHLEDEFIEFDDLPTQHIDQSFEKEQSLRLFVSLIHNPFKFWVQREEDSEKIDGLMDRLDHFYYRSESKIARTPIPEGFYKIGMMCAALYNAQWHRAKIIDTFDVSIKVFYVDYGTVGEAFKKDVRFLHKEFSSQPPFAMRGCIDKVRPYDGIWSFEALNAFEQRLHQFCTVPILAKITAINASEETLYLDLIDTSGVIDVSIAHWLLENNYAVSTRKLLINFEKRHYNEVYPSFDMLENDKYPSLHQIKWWKEKENIDFLTYEDSIIIPEMYGYETIE